jgi:hypothetical protein
LKQMRERMACGAAEKRILENALYRGHTDGNGLLNGLYSGLADGNELAGRD